MLTRATGVSVVGRFCSSSVGPGGCCNLGPASLFQISGGWGIKVVCMSKLALGVLLRSLVIGWLCRLGYQGSVSGRCWEIDRSGRPGGMLFSFFRGWFGRPENILGCVWLLWMGFCGAWWVYSLRSLAAALGSRGFTLGVGLRLPPQGK